MIYKSRRVSPKRNYIYNLKYDHSKLKLWGYIKLLNWNVKLHYTMVYFAQTKIIKR